MAEQFDPKLFVIRERYKFWSDLKRRTGESIAQLAARIRQDALTCEFSSIDNPQDDAMCTRFICSMQNEAFLKAVFKEKGGELIFAKAIQIANEIEETTKVAKETIGSNVDDTHAVRTQAHIPPRRSTFNKVAKPKPNDKSNNNGQPCGRCGKTGHTSSNCRYKT